MSSRIRINMKKITIVILYSIMLYSELTQSSLRKRPPRKRALRSDNIAYHIQQIYNRADQLFESKNYSHALTLLEQVARHPLTSQTLKAHSLYKIGIISLNVQNTSRTKQAMSCLAQMPMAPTHMLADLYLQFG